MLVVDWCWGTTKIVDWNYPFAIIEMNFLHFTFLLQSNTWKLSFESGEFPEALAGVPTSNTDRSIKDEGGPRRCQHNGGSLRERSSDRLPGRSQQRPHLGQWLRRPAPREAHRRQRCLRQENRHRKRQFCTVGGIQCGQVWGRRVCGEFFSSNIRVPEFSVAR